MAEELARQLGVSEGSLRAPVSENDLLEIATVISWKDVGPRLSGITRGDIHDIDRDGYDGPEKRSKMVDLWVERNGSNATYHAMITAMLATRKKMEAETVCRLLAPANGQPSPTAPVAVTPRSSQLDQKPALNGLVLKKRNREVRVLERIGRDYREFGIELLEDADGDKMDEIKENNSRAADMRMEIVRGWLRGKGKKPVTWRTLIEVLRKIELDELADDITDTLQ